MTVFKSRAREIQLLLRSVPSPVVGLFFVAVVAMNILANKSINMGHPWLALDCGILFSWLSFLLMDMLNKHFGAKAATQISIIALGVNLLVVLAFFLTSLIPGTWSMSYVDGSQQIINTALDNTFRGTWYVLLGSSVAFLVSSVVNNTLNQAIGKYLKNQDSFVSFALRSYISTFIAQLIDNFIFSLIVGRSFFGWTLLQCFMCALITAVIELAGEVIFSPLGYRITQSWQKDKVGQAYFDYLNQQ